MTGGRIDSSVIRRRLKHLIDAVAVLDEYRGLSIEDLTANVKTMWVVERGLQLCVQVVLDVAAHIVASTGASLGDGYRDHILALGELNVLPAEFAARIAPMAGFRNILVYDYLEVDAIEVHRALTERLDDLLQFARLIEQYVDHMAD